MIRITHKLKTQIMAISMMAVVLAGSVPASAFAAFTVDITANGQQSLALTSASSSFVIAVDAPGAQTCQLSAPATTGIGTSANITVNPGHPWYPAVGGSTTFTVACDDGTGNTISDSVVVSLASAPIGSATTTPTIDVKANGSDGPVTITPGNTFTYTWASTNSTACQETSPDTSGVSLSGTSVAIGPGHAFYPSTTTPTTITIVCTDGTNTATDSVVVNLGSVPVGTTTPTADIKANGSDGPVTIVNGSTFTYTWTSSNATACQLTSPTTSGIPLTGTSVPIAPGHAFYPSTTTPTTLTVSCTDGVNVATDSVVVNLGSAPLVTLPTVDVKANGSDGPVNLNSGATYTYTWTSANATACQLTSPTTSGVALAGTSAVIAAGHPFYPSVGTPTTITITCTDGINNASDSVVIALNPGGGGPLPTVDIKANGSDGPVTINSGDTYVLTWTSANATACQMNPPVVSGVSLTGTSSPIGPGPFYPAVNAPVTVTITCTNGSANASDSVVIQLANISSGGGGGGGSSVAPSNGNASMVFPGQSLGACPLIHDYMRIDFNNNPLEVMKLQAFLKFFMGYSAVSITGVFDQATYNAVGAFQMQYFNDILAPWGHTAPTHYVYILTLKKINELYCQHELPITVDQQHEIEAFRTLLAHAAASGIPVRYVNTVPSSRTNSSATYVSGSSGNENSAIEATSTSSAGIPSMGTTTIELPVVGQSSNGQNNLAAALFTFPDTAKGWIQCLYEFILILIVLYILGTVLKDVLYSDLPQNVLKRFIAKWTTIVLGFLAAIFIAYFLQEWCLLLPLVVVLVGAGTYMALYPKHPKMRAYLANRRTVTETKTTTNTAVPQGKPL